MFFIGIFKVESLPRMINKEVLAYLTNRKIVYHEKIGNFIL